MARSGAAATALRRRAASNCREIRTGPGARAAPSRPAPPPRPRVTGDKHRLRHRIPRRQRIQPPHPALHVAPDDRIQPECLRAAGGKRAEAVFQPGKTLVEPRKFAAKIVERRAAERIRAGRRIKRPAHQPRLGVGLRHRRPVGAREEGRGGILHHVGMDASVRRVPRIEHVIGKRRLRPEPAQGRHAGIAPQQPDMPAQRRLPRKRHLSGHRPRQAAGQRHHRKQHVPRGDREIMHHRAIRRLKALDPAHPSIRADGPKSHARRQRPVGGIAEKHQVSGCRIGLRVRGERPRQGAGKILHAARGQRGGVEFERQMRLLQRQQFAGVPDDVGVGHPGIGDVRALPPWPEACAQRPPRGVLGAPLVGAHPAVAVRRPAVLQAESVDHAVAHEPVAVWGRKLRIGSVAEQRPVQPARQFAQHGQVRRVALHRDRREILRRTAGIAWHHSIRPPVASCGTSRSRPGASTAGPARRLASEKLNSRVWPSRKTRPPRGNAAAIAGARTSSPPA